MTIMTENTEAQIIINGHALSDAQSMALRVACTSFHGEMSVDGALGEDKHGRQMAALYRERLGEVLHIILGRG